MSISIEFRRLSEYGRGWLDARTCQSVATIVLRAVKAQIDRKTLSVVMVGPVKMAWLARARGKRSATDVLAFALDYPMLGEIFLCPRVINVRARQCGRTPAAHTRALFVHGLLHLLGYDHTRGKDAAEMERVEQRILRKF